jgi:hypothetical protein
MVEAGAFLMGFRSFHHQQTSGLREMNVNSLLPLKFFRETGLGHLSRPFLADLMSGDDENFSDPHLLEEYVPASTM